ncbi:hypothetical protein [Halobacillus seohaensis]|uniref:Uncharacterized protein n=1 Tax=Halobacillus seohaensis TaxID=447421 RepID=A0ABW2EM62_9BACI
MIKNKKFLYIALILLTIFMVLNFPFPYENPYGMTVVSILNVPIEIVNGFNYIGLLYLVVFITGIYFLVKSLEKYRVRAVILSFITIAVLPMIFASFYQNTFAEGVYAVSYDQEDSMCEFEMTDSTKLNGVCEFPFKNHSQDDVQFSIDFYEQYSRGGEQPLMSLMQNNGPFEVSLAGKERKRVKVEADIDMSEMDDPIRGGSASMVHIILRSDELARKL